MPTCFTYQGNEYTVRIHSVGGHAVYRDSKHLGGPWSNAESTIRNSSIQLGFRRKLQEAVSQLTPPQGDTLLGATS